MQELGEIIDGSKNTKAILTAAWACIEAEKQDQADEIRRARNQRIAERLELDQGVAERPSHVKPIVIHCPGILETLRYFHEFDRVPKSARTATQLKWSSYLFRLPGHFVFYQGLAQISLHLNLHRDKIQATPG